MMPDRMLQNHNCVAALQQRLSYNATMSFPTDHKNDKSAASTRNATGPWRGAQICGAVLIVVTLLGIGVMVAACGSGSLGQDVASHGKATTTTGPSTATSGSAASRESIALTYVHCMRTHGEPYTPDPATTGNSVHISITAGSGVDPNSPQFARATNACKHLLPSGSITAPATSRPLGAIAADCLTASHCYAPRQFRVAYGIQPLLERGITGRGVTVVLPEEAETGSTRPQPITDLLQSVTDIRQDLADFDSRFGLPPARIEVLTNLAGSSASPWLAGVEEVEDTELVHAVAPDSTIRELLVESADVSTPAKLAATFASYVRTAVRNGEVMSQSGIGQNFNLGENSWTSAEVTTMNSALEHAAARHVTVVVASGDYGAIGNGSATPRKEVSLPASDPWALAVGGTTLTAAPVTGAYLSETAWNDQSGSPSASGGGFSRLFARPSYQNGVPGIGASRGVPDVAGDATSTSGMALAFTAPGGGDEFIGAGGTSAAAPFWAGLIALADQDAGHPLGLVNPGIYRIAQSPLYQKAFHDVTTGNNTVVLNGTAITGYPARPGWDPATGWGTPNAQVLIPLLAR
jgi:subtilase family serine protease